MSTAFYTHTDCRGHDMGPGHPECPQRLDAIEDHLLATGLDIALHRPDEVPLARHEDLMLAHSERYLVELDEFLRQAAETGEHRALDPDTSVCPATRQAMLRSVGAAIAATDAVIDGTYANAFCAIRPPGHHATRSEAMGFCFYNNIAIAARHALDMRGLERVAIIDFDVHHGNGTEDIVAGDDRILMASFFQDQIYPYSGGVPMGAKLIVDSTFVRELKETKAQLVALPITKAAREELGRDMFANIIALGAIVGLTGTVSRESLEKAVLARVPKGTEDKNRKALDLGFQLAKQA